MASKYLRRAQRHDRIATRVITGGGIAIIASVILILLLIVKEAAPLFYPTSVESRVSFPVTGERDDVLAVGLDEYISMTFAIRRDGQVVFQDAATGAELATMALGGPASPRLNAARQVAGSRYEFLWEDGSASLVDIGARPEYAEGERTLVPQVTAVANVPGSPELQGTTAAVIGQDERGTVTRADLVPQNRLAVTQVAVSEDVFGETSTETHTTLLEDAMPGTIADFTLDRAGKTLYAGTDNGFLVRWDLRDPEAPVLIGSIRAFDDGRAITALSTVLGDISVAVGDQRGGLETFSPVRPYPDAAQPQLRANHTLAPHDAAVTGIVPSQRDKSLLSVSEDGVVHLDHMTSERHLLSARASTPIAMASLAPRSDGIVAFDTGGALTVWHIDLGHPEATLHTLFGKVWYENYDEPAYVWQSSAATDEFEPKLSLVPLVFGSLKGTFYAMLYAIPLALFGAIYVSQFAADRVRGVVKPAIEIMAALPSVVIGFLCALWLAPIVERHIVTFLTAPFIMACAFLVFVGLWQLVRKRPFAKRMERGYEFLVLLPVLLLGAYVAYLLGPPIERLLFDGDFALWLFHDMGRRYDQRNSIIIAFGLGFAVIPIIFTIADDAISSVPHSLKAASLAMGATRWQTVWRVVLPAASPGIFAGMMIGFGRAVGETMIVLMATGNTPIMDWSIFNGMRTLSANIAVEIPEAPVGGTLYRVLFLSAVILFLLTFTVNTVAELVRQSLRKKYGRFQ